MPGVTWMSRLAPAWVVVAGISIITPAYDFEAGMVEINGSQSVSVDADLIGTLRELPGVRTVKMAVGHRPWAH